MAISPLVSTVLMGVLFLGVAYFMMRARRWYNYSIATEDKDVLDSIHELSAHPALWVASFFVVIFAMLVTALWYVGGLPMADQMGQAAGLAFGGIFGALVVFFIVVGAYRSGMSRGLKSSQAAGAAMVLFGVLLLAAVTAKLVAG